MTENFYVYGHYKPKSDIPFYIGKGAGKRAFSNKNRNNHWHNVVKKHGLRVEIMYENLSESVAFQLEKDFIKMYGRADIGCGPLVNMTDGGEGGVYNNLGRKHTKEHNEKISRSNIGRKKTKKECENLSKSRKEYLKKNSEEKNRLGDLYRDKKRPVEYGLNKSKMMKEKMTIVERERLKKISVEYWNKRRSLKCS